MAEIGCGGYQFHSMINSFKYSPFVLIAAYGLNKTKMLHYPKLYLYDFIRKIKIKLIKL